MFTLQKLLRLPRKTMLRKLALILQKTETDLAAGIPIDKPILDSILAGIIDRLSEKGSLFVDKIRIAEDSSSLARSVNNLRYEILSSLGSMPSEWDFTLPSSGRLDESKRTVFPISVFLEDIRSPYNVGSMFRTADSFGVSRIVITESTPLPTHTRAQRTSRGCTQTIPWSIGDLASIEREPFVFALETGGIPIDEFRFPASGIVLVGSEELGLSPEAIRLAQNMSGCVSIPLSGTKRSLNVSVAFGILMFHWYSYLSS
jgi:TrmH family RNA methyltransferase